MSFEKALRHLPAEILAALARQGWIDVDTRMVCAETLLFNAARGQYAVARFTVEFSPTGVTRPFVAVRLFWLMLVDAAAAGRALFALDVVLCAYPFSIAHDVARSVVVNRRLSRACAGFWEILGVGHAVLLACALGFRFSVWAEAADLASDDRGLPPALLYARLIEYEGLFRTTYHLLFATLFIAWLRVLEFMRYSTRLNAVTESVRLGSDGLISLAIIFVIVILLFALVGQGIFGWRHEEFSTLWRAMVWLSVLIFSGDLSEYRELRRIDPTWAPVYVVLFFLLSSFILLNIVLAILATAFSEAASSGGRQPTWDLRSLHADLVAIFLNHAHGPEPEPLSPGSRSPSSLPGSAAASEAGRLRLLFFRAGTASFVSRRIASIRCLHSLTTSTPTPEGLLSAEVRQRGWRLRRAETLATFKGAEQMVPDTFGDAEEARQAEQKAMIHNITRHIDKRFDVMRADQEKYTQQLGRDIGARVDSVAADLRALSARFSDDVRAVSARVAAAAGDAAAQTAQVSQRVAGARLQGTALRLQVSGVRQQVKGRGAAVQQHISTQMAEMQRAVAAQFEVMQRHVHDRVAEMAGDVAQQMARTQEQMDAQQRRVEVQLADVQGDIKGGMALQVEEMRRRVLDGVARMEAQVTAQVTGALQESVAGVQRHVSDKMAGVHEDLIGMQWEMSQHAALASAASPRRGAAAAAREEEVELPAVDPSSVADVRFGSSAGERVFVARGGALVYSLEGQERPPAHELRWSTLHASGDEPGWIMMPDIGIQFDPPREGLPEILAGLRVLAARAGIRCDIGAAVPVRAAPGAAASAAVAAHGVPLHRNRDTFHKAALAGGLSGRRPPPLPPIAAAPPAAAQAAAAGTPPAGDRGSVPPPPPPPPPDDAYHAYHGCPDPPGSPSA